VGVPLTRAEWDALPARERDALVAEHVMGWRVVRSEGDRMHGDDGLRFYATRDIVWRRPYFTVDIGAAWIVVEEMKEGDAGIRIGNLMNGGWRGAFSTIVESHEADADSAPGAICLAALAAKGVVQP
jgi:hypothetical protein